MIMRDRTRTRIRLGHYPALSLSEARKRAHAALGLGPTPKSEPAIRFSAVEHSLINLYEIEIELDAVLCE